MRVERIDLDGYQQLSGSFHLPAAGLGVWTTGNGTGKSRLRRALVAALYGDPAESAGWIMVRFRLDSGEHFSLARDLARGRVEITDASGDDVTARFVTDSGDVGRNLFGLTRDEFTAAACVDGHRLDETIGNPDLLSALGDRPAGAEATSLADAPTAEAPAEPGAANPAEDLDIRIFRTAAEEMSFLGEPVPEASQGIEVDFEIETSETHPEPADDVPVADPDEPGIEPLERLRRLRAALAALDIRHTSKKQELVDHSERLHDMQTEGDRLASLAEAEPRDVAELRRILDRLTEIDEATNSVARRDAEHRRKLEEAGVAVGTLEKQTRRFERLDGDDREFLETFRQAETIHRGNQALIRSESRLDRKRLAEIAAAQEKAARLAMFPLGGAILGIAGSLILPFVDLPVPSGAPLAFGFVAALAGGGMLWRARRIRAEERAGIKAGQERKEAQLEELEREEREATFRIEGVAEKCGLENAAGLLDQFEHWVLHSGERAELERFVQSAEELDRERATLREKLGRFAAARAGGEPADASVVDPDQVHRDYVRFFELRDIIQEAEKISAGIEDELIALETDRAELKQRIEDVLSSAGVDPEGRADGGAGFPVNGPEASEPAAEPVRAIEMEWSPAVSARTEAILRRFLPEVREIEVDGTLAPSLRVGRETLRFEQVQREFSEAALDQVYLALRLAIVETLGSSGERLPVFLDDPLTRADDSRHDRALEFLVEDASIRGQVVFLTAQEVRMKWFLHQFPQHREALVSVADSVAPAAAPATRPEVSTPEVTMRSTGTGAPSAAPPAGAPPDASPRPPLPSSSAPL